MPDGLDHHEPLAVRRNVVIRSADGNPLVRSLTEQMGRACTENWLGAGLGLGFDGYHPVAVPIEQFPITRPDRFRVTLGGYLPFVPRTRERPDIDFVAAGLIGDIGHHAAGGGAGQPAPPFLSTGKQATVDSGPERNRCL